MDWSKGYSARWRVFEVDTATWADAGLVGGIVSASIERDGGDRTPLLESGSVTVDRSVGEYPGERYLRIVMYAGQGGGTERVDLATLLCSSVEGEVDKGADTVELTGRSVLWPASTRKVLNGTYAPRGVNGAEWCADMLRGCIAAPVEFEGGFSLESHVVFDTGATYLECVWQVLDAGGYVMQIGGDGTVRIVPRPTEPALLLDTAGARLVMPAIKYGFDWSEVPNRYTAVEGSMVSTAENNDSASPVSIPARGYIVDEVDTSPARVDGESLAQYAIRRLEELSVMPEERTYKREYYPGVYPYSVVRGTLASVGLEGDLRVVTQAISCDKGVTVQEKAKREVRLWPM